MKNLYLLLLIVLSTISDIYGQTQTETVNAISTGVNRVYNWGTNFTCSGTNYVSQSGVYYNAGFKSTGSSSCFTETTYRLRSKFSHPNFTNSQITQLTFHFNVQQVLPSNFTQLLLELNVPMATCSGLSNNQTLFGCLNCDAPNNCILLANNIVVTSSWQTKTITINNTHPGFLAFVGSSTETIIGFHGLADIININNISCDITYNCSPASTPSGLSASSISSSQINLNWNAVSGATGYNVYNCSGTTPIASTTSTNYSFTGLQQGTSYGYRVKAINNCAPSTSYSPCVNASTSLTTPSGLISTATSNSTIQLIWTAAVGATGYDIYNCTGSLIGSSSGTAYNVTGLTGGTNYSYKIRAKNATINSNFTSCVGALTFPNTPIGFATTPISSTEISLTWNITTGASSYDIYSCSGIFIANSSLNSFTVVGLTVQTNYDYKIIAKNTSGNSGFTNCVNTTTLIAAPINLIVTATSNSTIQLTWTGIGGLNGGYEIYDCVGNFITNEINTSHTITGLSSGTNYSYKVRTIGNTNNSAFTSCVTTTTFIDAPTWLTVNLYSYNELRLKWSPIVGATGYEIYDCSGVFIKSVGPIYVSTYVTTVISNLTPNTYYEFKVLATSSSGNSSFSSCGGGTTSLPLITNFTATIISGTEIKFDWDAAPGINYYQVKREGATTLSTTSTSLNFTGLAPNINSLRFRVRGIGATNNTPFSQYLYVDLTLDEPQNFTVVFNDLNSVSSGFALNWDPVPNATSYEISPCTGTGQYGVATFNYYYQFVGTIPEGASMGFRVRALFAGNTNSTSSYSPCEVAFHTPNCSSSINVSGQTHISNKIYKSSGLISIGTSTVEPTYAVVAESETTIKLQTGFKAKAGCFFNANTVSCSTTNFKTGLEPEEDVEESELVRNSVKVYPNPNKGQFTIDLNSNEENILIEVYDMMGEQVFSENTNEVKRKIDISNHPKGIYLVKITVGNKVFNEKIIYQ